MKHILFAFLNAVLILSISVCGLSETVDSSSITVIDIKQTGNLTLSITGSELFEKGFTFGDLVSVTINNSVYEMPIGCNYSDVEQGIPICRVVITEDPPEDSVTLAINMGDLATTSSIATKEQIDAYPGYIWHYNEGVTAPVSVSIEMKEQGAYYDEWALHQLVRTNNREDYPTLTDEEFANFRPIEMGDITASKLYRSSSPLDPGMCRNTYADQAAAAAGIKTIINLVDNKETLLNHEGFKETYYSKQIYIPLNMGVDINSDEFKHSFAEGLRFMASHDAPYLIHCTEGKDRAGFVSAILECLMGGTKEEIFTDYMTSYQNYYGVEPDTKQYDIFVDRNILKSLCVVFDLETLDGADLRLCAETYLQNIGLSQDEIESIKTCLGK